VLSTLNAIPTSDILKLPTSSIHRFSSFPQAPDRNSDTPSVRSSPRIRQTVLALDAEVQRHVQRAGGEEGQSRVVQIRGRETGDVTG